MQCTRTYLAGGRVALAIGLLILAGCSGRIKNDVSRGEDMSAKTKMALKDAKAHRVWDIFRQINRVPRCSKNEGPIIEWLKDFADSRKLACRSDAVGNTVIELPATKGYEKSPAVVLQSHVDMVCEKTPESKHDFSKDPIELIERDGWVCADGTTLGADNGVGVSLALALVGEKIAHPRLELLFTVDEETGLTGANALQKDFITGRKLINLDGEDESIIAGCAGGEQTEIKMKLDFVDAPSGLDCFTLKVSGLLGGHSGVDIDKKRANAIKLLAGTLKRLQEKFDLRICSIDAGKAANAIPRDAQTVILLIPSQADKVRGAIADIESSFKKEFAKTDSGIKVELVAQSAGCQKIWSSECSKKVVCLLFALPMGVYCMSKEFKGTVETSDNLARVETMLDEKILRITTMQRSFKLSSMDELTGKITAISESAGAKAITSGRYPSWKPDTNSSLLKQAKVTFKRLHKREPKVIVVHAGLECAVIGEKMPGIEMISTGPTIENLHSPGERVNIASVDNAWRFLITLLPVLK
jgi:dipeptidase D